MHPSGRRYEWEFSLKPGQTPLVPAPEWLLEALGARAQPRIAEPIAERIPDGQRNATLASLAGSMRRRGATEEEILAALHVANTNRCEHRLPHAEVAAIAASVARYRPAPDAAPAPPEQTAGAFLTWQNMALEIGAICWDWHPWLPRGLLTMLAGESGMGKSGLALRIAACLLRGDPWPDGAPYTGNLGAVLWIECEAAQAVNLERATTWNLPLNWLRSLPLDVSLENQGHLASIAREAAQADVRLVIVDSLRGAHGGDENSSQTMTVVKALASLARDTGKPILLTHHLRKRGLLDLGERVGLDRLRGSSAIVQTARVVWALDAPDPTHEEQRRLSVIKSNLAAFPQAVGLTISADGVTFGAAPEPPRQETQLDRAKDFLTTALRNGEKPQEKVQTDAAGLGISVASIGRAKIDLRIVSTKRGSAWWWGLPAVE